MLGFKLGGRRQPIPHAWSRLDRTVNNAPVAILGFDYGHPRTEVHFTGNGSVNQEFAGKLVYASELAYPTEQTSE